MLVAIKGRNHSARRPFGLGLGEGHRRSQANRDEAQQDQMVHDDTYQTPKGQSEANKERRNLHRTLLADFAQRHVVEPTLVARLDEAPEELNKATCIVFRDGKIVREGIPIR